MNLHTRIARLERPAPFTDAAIRAAAETAAQRYDLGVDELIEEMRLVLAMTPTEFDAERQQYATEIAELEKGHNHEPA